VLTSHWGSVIRREQLRERENLVSFARHQSPGEEIVKDRHDGGRKKAFFSPTFPR
jgi:hypothetical protein